MNNIRIVLVHTTHPGNIGGAARAMKNMGLSKLYLVKPKRYPAEEAVWRASSAADVLENAIITDTLDEAIADCSLVVGTSARDRRIPWPSVNPHEFAEIAIARPKNDEIALIFGREDRGLTNDELQKCNYHVHIPANPDYSSLNLATAVQVLCYELRMRHLAPAIQAEQQAWDVEFATAQQVELFFEHLEKTLVQLEFLDPANPRQLMTRLRRLYNRVGLDEMEINILRGILTATQKADKK